MFLHNTLYTKSLKTHNCVHVHVHVLFYIHYNTCIYVHVHVQMSNIACTMCKYVHASNVLPPPSPLVSPPDPESGQ